MSAVDRRCPYLEPFPAGSAKPLPAQTLQSVSEALQRRPARGPFIPSAFPTAAAAPCGPPRHGLSESESSIKVPGVLPSPPKFNPLHSQQHPLQPRGPPALSLAHNQGREQREAVGRLQSRQQCAEGQEHRRWNQTWVGPSSLVT